jgi:ferritin-like metal-binding protein YciE
MGKAMAMKMNSLETLFVDTLKDLYDAEHQIIDALPKMAEAASSPDLKQSLRQHLDVTRHQAQRLEQVFSAFNERPTRKKCAGMEGLIKEGEQHMKELKSDKDALDAGLIASAQKVEHYEIASYGTAKSYAEMLGKQDAVNLLDQTLSEEYATDERLTRLAESHINIEAMI